MSGQWTSRDWTECECQRVYSRAKTDPGGAPEEPFSEIWSLFIRPSGVLCPREVEVLSPLPTGPIVRATTDTRCMAGPSVHYRIENTFTAGVPASLRGRNPDARRLQILSPNLPRLR